MLDRGYDTSKSIVELTSSVDYCRRLAVKRFASLISIVCAVACGSNAIAQNSTFDGNTGLLTLPAIDIDGTTYTNVVVQLNSATVVSVGGSFPTSHVAIKTTSSGGLSWTDPSTYAYTWSEANTYCNSTSFNGLGGWRLPSKPETLNSPSNADIWTNQPYVGSATSKESKHYVTSTIRTSGAVSQTTKIFFDYQPNYVMCVK